MKIKANFLQHQKIITSKEVLYGNNGKILQSLLAQEVT